MSMIIMHLLLFHDVELYCIWIATTTPLFNIPFILRLHVYRIVITDAICLNIKLS